ncbi:fused signal recognition particle receptor [Rhodopseudomonas julia]|uniref:Signal recognition particle receptor FtsY n=1 Tax=Rhodopseudomonas julia TaxID=200617 RepID=A0ABU0C583_9BRAD|nr:signal recognition particle-docking protein FtsY [Rhodopseudomonas julia]MDQ0325669.1 fused signal recognition particle receptor [Rhodopseudomonas julia]
MAKEKRGFFKRILFGEGNDVAEKEAERDETQLTDAEAAEESEAALEEKAPEEAASEDTPPEETDDEERLAGHQLDTEDRGAQTTETDIGIVEEAEAPDADLHRPAAAPADADAEATSFAEHPVKEPEPQPEKEADEDLAARARAPEPEAPARPQEPAEEAAIEDAPARSEPAEDELEPEEKRPADIGALPESAAKAETTEAETTEATLEETAKPATDLAPDDAANEPQAAEVEPVEEPAEAETVSVATELPRQNWLQRLRAGLSKSSNTITSRLTGTFTKRRLDDETLEDLEDILIQADLGVATATAITERLARERYDKTVGEDEIRKILAEEVAKVLGPVTEPLAIDAAKKPFVILVVGVNGSGKTTTIGKLAAKLHAEGRSVMLAAGDTFRAAAIEQLKIWGERTRSTVISRDQGADAAGLVFDAMQAAKKEGSDVLIIDTAGRLQNRAELMDELEKVVRVIKKHDPSAPHTTLLTLDATTGQNALSQVEIFGQRAGVTGLVMTKLDGTARGGILVAIAAKHALPVHFIGVGEGIDDLQPFKAEDFARAIAGM